MKYDKLSVTPPEDLLWDNAKYPVAAPRGLVIGGPCKLEIKD